MGVRQVGGAVHVVGHNGRILGRVAYQRPGRQA